MAKGMGEFRVMNRQHRARAVQLIALAFCYLWYNAAIHRAVVRVVTRSLLLFLHEQVRKPADIVYPAAFNV